MSVEKNTTVTPDPMLVAKKKVENFSAKHSAIVTFIEDSQSLFNTFFELADSYNTAREAAKEAIKQIVSQTGFSIGPFKKSKQSVTESYDPALLPAAVLQAPGVIESVNTAAVDNLLKAGVVDAATLAKARIVKYGSAKIDGPAELKLNL